MIAPPGSTSGSPAGPTTAATPTPSSSTDGTCTVEKGAAENPDLSLMLGPAEFLKLITGTGNPAMMFMMGKVKARGDLGLASGSPTGSRPPSPR